MIMGEVTLRTICALIEEETKGVGNFVGFLWVALVYGFCATR